MNIVQYNAKLSSELASQQPAKDARSQPPLLVTPSSTYSLRSSLRPSVLAGENDFADIWETEAFSGLDGMAIGELGRLIEGSALALL